MGWEEKQKAGTIARKGSRFDERVYFLGWERSGELEVKNNRVRKNRDVFYMAVCYLEHKVKR